MTSLTPRQLLAQQKALVASGPTLDIDADIPLDEDALSCISQALLEDKALIGLTVVATDGQALGVLSVATMKEYLARSATVEGTRGPNTGSPVMVPSLYRCNVHNYQRISWTQPKCRLGGEPMQLVEG